MPLPLCFAVATGIVVFSLYFSSRAVMPVEILRFGSYFAMPECLSLKITELKNELLMTFGPDEHQQLMNSVQKDSMQKEITQERNFNDLSETPDDIEQIMQTFALTENEIEYDGVTLERSYSDYQATDSYGNVYIRNTTEISDVDIKGILTDGCSLPIENFNAPTVLIFHTHSTESYKITDNGKILSSDSSRSNNKSLNMIRIGEEISAVLRSEGVGVIHDTTIYDTSYNGAYGASREGISRILAENPTIKIVLDIHRDAVHYDDYTYIKPTAEINGEKAAQLMIITGAQGGGVKDFPNWRKNLSFAVNLQSALESKYAGLMKPVLFSHRKYNMDITEYSLLIEVGTDANTLEEAAYSGRLLGDVLADFIKENQEM